MLIPKARICPFLCQFCVKTRQWVPVCEPHGKGHAEPAREPAQGSSDVGGG